MIRLRQIFPCVALVAAALMVWAAPASAQGITVSFAGASSDAPESLAQPVIVVKLSGPSTEQVSVHYSVTGGTATGGDTPQPPADYVLADGDLTFPPGSITQTISLLVVDDSEVEQSETVLLALSNPQNAALGAQVTHTFTVRDDDAKPTPVVEFSATASAGGEAMGTAKLAVVVYPQSEEEVSVRYSVVGGTATSGGDYALEPGTLTFAPGETAKVISLIIKDDTEVEDSETVLVQLTDAQGAVLGYKSTHTFTVLDNDKAPEILVSFQAAQSVTGEDVGTAQIAVLVTGGPRQDSVTVSYGVGGGTATGGGVDYTLPNGTLTFAPDEAAKSIPIQVVDDNKVEASETVLLALSNPVGAKLGRYPNHEYTIRDNDLPLVSFALAQSQVDEGSGRQPITLLLSEASPEPVLVDFAVDGTATQGEDYSLAISTVTFKPGDTSALIVPEILDDAKKEPDETIVLTLTTPINAKLGTPDVHTMTIKDNDAPEVPAVSFETEASMDDESVAGLSIPVLLSYAVEKEVTVTIEVSGTATINDDFKLTSATVVFSAGSTRAYVSGTVVDDTIDEPDETIVLTLKDPLNAKLGSPRVHTYTIIDNDYVAPDLSLFKQEVGTVDGKIFTVLGPKALSVEPRGLAVDDAGNYYISDWGATAGGAEGEGGILFWPRGQKSVVRIMSGLTRPGDVELSPDQRALLIACVDGTVKREALGVSIRFTNIDPFEGGVVAHIFGAGPEKVVKVSPDGYFHVLGLLESDAKKNTIDVTVERHGKSKTFTAIPLGQSGGTYGHRIVKLEF